MLHVHRSERSDVLLEGLAELLVVPPRDPFTPDVVAVPSRGVERWLAQSLSHVLGASAESTSTDGVSTDGISAHIDFSSPVRLVAEAVSAATGVPAEEDPWAEHRLPWPLLAVIDACASEPWCPALGRHLGAGLDEDDHRHGRRFAVASHFAGLFTAYAAQRPAMLRHWAAGADTDAAGAALPADLAWQAELWRRLRDRIGTPSPAERLEEACARVRADPDVVRLPERVSLFGPTRLATDQMVLLDALAEHRDVHLWLPHPSPALWAAVQAAPDPATAGGPVRRRDDPTAGIPVHPLVSSLARDARELQVRLRRHVRIGTDDHRPVPAGSGPGPDTLLGRLHGDIHADRPPPGAPVRSAADGRALLDPGDRSLQVHACYGRQRQVEVLREVLLGLLADDPTLELRDIIVMCPDIEVFAPLISATFGLDPGHADQPADPHTGGHPAHRLRVRLADRSLRQTNPVLSGVAKLLDLADARVTVSEVMDLASMPPVRRRFGFDDADLERLADWVRAAGVRWGIDAQHRAGYQLDVIRQNTWETGLDRVLVGAAMAEDGLQSLGLALPLDDVESNDIDLAGRLAELVDRVTAALDSLTGRRPLSGWVDALLTATEDLMAVSAADAWQMTQARFQLSDAVGSAGEPAGTVDLSLSDVRALLGRRLRGRPTRASFRTGHLTMCSLVPMRSVPHRVVFLLGLDDGAFPRGSYVDGDDVLLRNPLVGERDQRTEDRQLFLDAVLAAGQHLVIVHTGADERTGAVQPPAVPVGELLDVVDATVRTATGAPAREQVMVRHPLQTFDGRNFRPGALGSAEPLSFDRPALAGARALQHDRVSRPPFLAGPLPPERPESVEVDTLVGFLEHPVKTFLRARLGLASLGEDDPEDDALPVELSPLQAWAVGDHLLTARLAGAEMSAATRAERLRGAVPPGALGTRRVDDLAAEVDALVLAAAAFRTGPPRHVDVAATLDDGLRLHGTIGGVHENTLVRVVYSRLAAKHRVRAWVQLLALVAADPDTAWRAVTIGRGGRSPSVATVRLAGIAPDRAREELASLVDLYLRGLCEPLPLVTDASHAYAEMRRRGSSPMIAAREAEKRWSRDGTHDDEHHVRAFGGDVPFDVLLDQPADPAERTGDWCADEPTRFGVLATRLWTPMLAAETAVGR